MMKRIAAAFLAALLSTAPAIAASLSHTQTVALAASLSIPAGAQLVSFDVSADSTLSAAAWWILVFNASSAPADGAVTPDKCYPMSAGEIRLTGLWTPPIGLGKGATIVVSTTGCFTKTASAHAFIGMDFQ